RRGGSAGCLATVNAEFCVVRQLGSAIRATCHFSMLTKDAKLGANIAVRLVSVDDWAGGICVALDRDESALFCRRSSFDPGGSECHVCHSAARLLVICALRWPFRRSHIRIQPDKCARIG